MDKQVERRDQFSLCFAYKNHNIPLEGAQSKECQHKAHYEILFILGLIEVKVLSAFFMIVFCFF